VRPVVLDDGLGVEMRVAPGPLGTRVEWSVRNDGNRTVFPERVGLAVDGAQPRLVLEHGWQSWSAVRPCPPADTRPPRRDAPGWVRAMYLADPATAGERVAGDQFLLTDAGVVGFLGGAAHLGTVTVEPGGGVVAWALLDGVPVEPGESRELEPVWVAGGDPGSCYSAYAEAWGRAAGARASAPAPVGWCSWYDFFGEVTPADVRANVELAAAHGIEVVQVDDGWQGVVGDWLSEAPAWAGGALGALAGEIAERGLVAGLWTAPFLAAENLRPGWAPRHESGRPLRAVWNEAWGGWALALDTTRPDVLDHLRETYAALRAAGFAYHKVDFCYAAAMPGARHDPHQTRAQALRAGLLAVREGIGDDAFLLGCGCPFGPAAGVVDAMRVSADVAPYWDPPLAWPGFEECPPAARNAIAASLLRAPLHRRLWVNDPDCVLLRDTATDLTPAQVERLAGAVLAAGGFTVVSDDLRRYGPAQWDALERLVAARAERDRPLDVEDPFATPLVVGGPAVAHNGGP
jgi:alpha-galactosidase